MTGEETPRRIISLDYCADQYVLKFADRDHILALSPDAEKHFSFMRNAAVGLQKVRPRTADVLALEPDLVVRSYGGGPNVTTFLERAGVPVVQIGFPGSIAEVRSEVVRLGTELGAPEKAKSTADEMDRRLAAVASGKTPSKEALYMTPYGFTTGEGTLTNELITTAGLLNFQDRPGWNPLPLERLAYERPDLVAAAYFEGKTNHEDNWSAARHPVARAQMRDLPVVPLQGAWMACGGWFQLEAVEALAKAAQADL
ncbi:MAG: ABC transporter substrate-binding protein [Pseudomonadota bacterium]